MIAPELNSMPAVMKRRVALSVLLLSLLGSAGGVWAQQGYWRELPPDERRQIRQEMREHWQQLPSEQRQNQRREQRERWQQMPPEERQRAKDEWRQQRQQLEGGYDGQPQRGRGRP